MPKFHLLDLATALSGAFVREEVLEGGQSRAELKEQNLRDKKGPSFFSHGANKVAASRELVEGRLSKQPGDSRGVGQRYGGRCGNAVTMKSTVLVVLILLGTVLLLDSYKWRRLTLPWSFGFSEGPYEVSEGSTFISSPPRGGRLNDTQKTPLVAAFSSAEGLLNSTRPTQSVVDDKHIKPSPPSPVRDPSLSPPPVAIAAQNDPSQSSFEVQWPPPVAVAHPSPKAPVLLTALDKLEYGLRQARFGIRNAFMAEKNGTQMDASQDDEPHGDVYRNSAIFRQSYREMERRFKIYVYSEGEEPLVHNGPCKEIYAIEGRFIQELQGENPFLTKDPDKAHVFFLPFSVAMMVAFLYEKESGNMEPLQLFVYDYVNVVMQKYPFWNRSDGADHFMLSCHDWGPAITKINSDLATRSIRVLCNANTTEGYIPWKDASLPEINLVGGHIPAELGGPPAQDRPHLAFFAGRDHGPVRPELFKYWEGKDNDLIVYQWLPSHLNYHLLMKTSRFCLCPGGYEVNSPRIVEAIYNECVPVIIADSFVLPFSDVLNWQSFSIHVKESDIPNLKSILQNVTMDTYISMQRKVSRVQRHFLLHQPPQRYDVFHMILHSVWLRRLNIQVGSS